MKYTNNTADRPELESRLAEKIEQYRKAEEEGASREALHVLYKEVKELRQRIDMMKPELRALA